MFCTKCGAPLNGSKFCTSCGTPANIATAAPAADDNCAVCGAPLEGRAFCVMCGAKKGAAPAPVVEETPVVEEAVPEEPAVEAAPAADDNCAVCGAPLEGRAFCVMCGAKKGAEPAPVVEEIPVVEESAALAAPAADDNCAVCGAPLEGRAFCVMCGAKKGAEPAPVVEEIPVVEESAAPAAPAADDNCAVCGAPLEGRAFCVMCGAKRETVPAPIPEPAPAPVPADNCKNCGAPLDGKAFCVMCGTPKDGAKPAPAPAPAAADNCAVCGAPLNGKAFCVVCGTAKGGAAPVKQPVQTTYIPPVQPIPTPEVSPLKKVFGSGKFLVTTIFVTLYVLMSIFAGAGDLGIPDIPYEIRNAMSTGAIAGNIIPILIAVGLWITYITAKGRGKLSSAGLSIISVIMLLNLIAAWIPFAIVAVIGLVFLITGIIMLATGRYEVFNGFITTDYGSGGAAGAILVGFLVLVVAAILLMFILLVYRRLRLFAKSAVKSVKADKAEYVCAAPTKRWLTFIGIMNIIVTVIIIIVGLAIPANGMTMIGFSNLFSALAILFGASWIKRNCVNK